MNVRAAAERVSERWQRKNEAGSCLQITRAETEHLPDLSWIRFVNLFTCKEIKQEKAVCIELINPNNDIILLICPLASLKTPLCLFFFLYCQAKLCFPSVFHNVEFVSGDAVINLDKALRHISMFYFIDQSDD